MVNIHFKTFGCANNLAESEIMAGLLKNHKITNEEEADIIILNLCTVKGDAHAIKITKELAKKYPEKHLILAGCLLKETIEKLKEISNKSILNTHNIDKIEEIIQKGGELTSYRPLCKADQPRVRTNPLIAIIPISTGCVSHCTYCSVKRIKGNLISFPEEKIIKDVKKAVKEGCKEIWLTSQDNGCYGFDIGTNCIELTNKILIIPGDFKVRLGMANPQHLFKYTKELIKLLKKKKVFTFLHVPIQSGSDEVLKKMGREHTIKEFKDFIRGIRNAIPNVTIATDIICGFPGETEKQFQETLKLLEELQFDAVNISRFQKREYTKAANMKQIPGRITKQRSRAATIQYQKNAQQRNERYLHKKMLVTITEKGKNNSWVARNQTYKPIILEGNYKLGQRAQIEIIQATPFDLRAKHKPACQINSHQI